MYSLLACWLAGWLDIRRKRCRVAVTGLMCWTALCTREEEEEEDDDDTDIMDCCVHTAERMLFPRV